MKRTKAAGACALEQTPELLNVEQLAALLGQASKTIRNKQHRGALGIPVIRLGRTVRFDPRDVDAYLLSCREGGQL